MFGSYGWPVTQKMGMNRIIEKYGLTPVSRPKVKLSRELDLSGQKGKEIARSKTKLVMQVHQKTFAKLANMECNGFVFHSSVLSISMSRYSNGRWIQRYS